MSKNYDYALALIENDVRNDCEYYVYSRLRDVVDGLENDNEVLTKLLRDALEKKYSKEDELQAENAKLRELLIGMAERVTNPVGGCLAPGCALGCPHHLECDEELRTCWYVDRLRELGIEV